MADTDRIPDPPTIDEPAEGKNPLLYLAASATIIGGYVGQMFGLSVNAIHIVCGVAFIYLLADRHGDVKRLDWSKLKISRWLPCVFVAFLCLAAGCRSIDYGDIHTRACLTDLHVIAATIPTKTGNVQIVAASSTIDNVALEAIMQGIVQGVIAGLEAK